MTNEEAIEILKEDILENPLNELTSIHVLDETVKVAIQALQKQMPLKEHLKKIEELEAEVIMTDDCWTHGYCSLTEEITKKWLVLQEERNLLLYT